MQHRLWESFAHGWAHTHAHVRLTEDALWLIFLHGRNKRQRGLPSVEDTEQGKYVGRDAPSGACGPTWSVLPKAKASGLFPEWQVRSWAMVNHLHSGLYTKGPHVSPER